MTDESVLIVRGEYAGIERDLAACRADYTREVKGFSGFALTLSRNPAGRDLCECIASEQRRLAAVADLCKTITSLEMRRAELAPLTGWFN